MKQASSLQIAASAAAPLTPEQRKFNQLVAKIDKLRAELALWDEQLPLLAQSYGERVRPLRDELRARQRELALKLEAVIARPGWSKSQRGTLRELVCEVAADVIEDEDAGADEAAEMKALFDRHAEVDFDTENRAAMAGMKEVFERMSGLDLGDEEFESEDDLMRRAHQRMGERQEQHEQRAGAGARPAGKRPARHSAAQRRREQEVQDATQSMREVYRKLASALHPDRASDEAERTHRNALMQRVNQAYEAKDLLTLFTLQLEIEQVDAAHLARAGAERVRHYNKVLSEQVARLQAELEARQTCVCMDFGLDPFERLHPLKLGIQIEQQVRELRAALAEARQDIARLDDPAAARRWLKAVQRQRKADADDEGFDFSF